MGTTKARRRANGLDDAIRCEVGSERGRDEAERHERRQDVDEAERHERGQDEAERHERGRDEAERDGELDALRHGRRDTKR